MHRLTGSVESTEAETGVDTGWAFLQLIVAVARERPVVVVVDDVHWAEPTFLDLLLDVAARLRDLPVLIVLVTRPELMEDRPTWSGSVRTATTMRLGPLSATASNALLAAISGGRLQQDEERQITDTAGGNPLFLEQLVAYVGEGRSTDALPPALHALLAARLDRLDTVERSVLALGAVVGDRFETAAVHALATDVSRAEIEQACDRLVEHDLLTEQAGGDGVALRFRHALIRDTAYSTLAKSARTRPSRATRLLAGGAWKRPSRRRREDRVRSGRRPAAMRRRSTAGLGMELAARAGRHLAAAARVAHAQGDLLGEIGFLERSLRLLGYEREEGVELLPALVSALFEAGSFDRAEEVAELAVSASASVGLPRVQARAAVERERIYLARRPEDVPGRNRGPRHQAGRTDASRTWRPPRAGTHGST